MVAIVDYGMGNLLSVQKALENLGAQAQVTSSPVVLARAKQIVLPGVGAFGDAMKELRRRRLVKPLLGQLRSGVPFLGLCLGLQLLFESSEESPGVKGLGFFKGKVKRLRRPSKQLKVPHMGWNQLEFDQKRHPCPLLTGVANKSFVYFVHSYAVVPSRSSLIGAKTNYGSRFPAVVWDGHVAATQFHPEKSQRTGLKILKNFLSWS